MAKRLKRAFTITELVIVIAVVAILAAVLIPTFTNIIKKADESADTQLVKNLNTILSSEQTVSQEAAPTMSKALEQAQSGGYTVDKLTPTSDGDILWEQDSNRFVLVSDGKIIFKDSTTTASIQDEPYKFWKITNEDGEIKNNTAGYSYYLGNKYSGGKTLDVTAGLDVGEQAIEKITYTTGEEQAVVFNTSGGTLEINAPNSDVKHYGEAKVVNVNEVKEQSYHLYGTVSDTLKVTKGHIYIEATGTVNVLDGTAVTEESGKATATIDMSSSATVGTVVIAKDVAEAALGTALKGAVEGGAVDTVEEIPEEASLFAGGIGTEKSPFLIETAVQFAAIGQLSEEMKNGTSYHFELVDNIQLSQMEPSNSQYLIQTFSGVLDGKGHTIYGADRVPYIFYYSLNNTTYKDFTVNFAQGNITRVTRIIAFTATGVESTDLSSVTLTYENVDYVGVTNTNYNMGDNNSALYYNGNCTETYALVNGNYLYTMNDTVQVNGSSDYLSMNLVLEDCDVTADFVGGSGNSGAAVFLGGQIGEWTYPVFRNCSYTGTFTGKNVGVLFANASWTSDDAYLSHVTVENLQLTGQILSLGGNSGVTFSNSKKEHSNIDDNCISKVVNLVPDEKLAVTGQENSEYTITAAQNTTVSYYIIQLNLLSMYWYNNGYDQPSTAVTNSNNIRFRVSAEDIENTSVFKAKAISLYEAKRDGVVANNFVCESVSIDGLPYAYFTAEDGTKYLVIDYEKVGMPCLFNTIDYVTATVFAYNTNGSPIAYADEN